MIPNKFIKQVKQVKNNHAHDLIIFNFLRNNILTLTKCHKILFSIW